MLRRKPTRLELKIDDTEEFESVKKELEARKRQREADCGAEGGGGASSSSGLGDDVIGDVIAGGGGASSGSAAMTSSGSQGRAELINERIGFKPHPKPNTHTQLFGSLQF